MPNDKINLINPNQVLPDNDYINPITGKPYFEDEVKSYLSYNIGRHYLPSEQKRLLGTLSLDVSPAGLEVKMAGQQSIGEKVWRIGKGFATNFAAGVIYSIGAYDPKMSLDIIEAGDIEWNNLYRVAQEMQNKAQNDVSYKVYSVYDPSETRFDSAAWWKYTADTQGLSMGAMALAVATSIAIESLTAGFGSEAAAMNIAKALKTTADVERIAKAINLASKAIQTMALARTINRHSESVLEAWDSYTTTYQNMINFGYSEDVAKDYASKAASMTYKMQIPLLALDLLSVFTLVPTTSGLTGLGESLLAQGIKSKALRTLVGFGIETINEAAEEGYQQYVQGKVMNDILHSADMDYFGFYNTWGKDMWDAMLQGAMGVPFTTLLMRGGAKIVHARRSIRAKKYYDESVNTLAENRLSLIKQINDELSKGENADMTKIEQLKDILNVYNTTYALYLDGSTDKEKALAGYKTFIQGVINNIDNKNFEALKEFNVNENNAIEVRKYMDSLLTDINFMESIYKQLVSNKVPHDIAMNATKHAMFAEKAKRRIEELTVNFTQGRQDITNTLGGVLSEDEISILADAMAQQYKKEVNDSYIKSLFSQELSKEKIQKIAETLRKAREGVNREQLKSISKKLHTRVLNKYTVEDIINRLSNKLGEDITGNLIADSLLRESIEETRAFHKEATKKFAEWIDPTKVEEHKKKIEEANKKKIEEIKKANEEAKKKMEEEKGVKKKVDTGIEDKGEFDLNEANEKHTDGTVEDSVAETVEQGQTEQTTKEKKLTGIDKEIANLQKQLEQAQTEEEKVAIQTKINEKQKQKEEIEKKRLEEERKKQERIRKEERVKNAVINLKNILKAIDEELIKNTIALEMDNVEDREQVSEETKKEEEKSAASILDEFIDIEDDEELGDPIAIADKVYKLDKLPQEYKELITTAVDNLIEAIRDLTGIEKPPFEMVSSYLQTYSEEDFSKVYTAFVYGWMNIKKSLPRNLVTVYKDYKKKLESRIEEKSKNEVEEEELKKKKEIEKQNRFIEQIKEADKELAKKIQNKLSKEQDINKGIDIIYSEVKKRILELKKENRWGALHLAMYSDILTNLDIQGYDISFANTEEKKEEQQQAETTQQQKTEQIKEQIEKERKKIYEIITKAYNGVHKLKKIIFDIQNKLIMGEELSEKQKENIEKIKKNIKAKYPNIKFSNSLENDFTKISSLLHKKYTNEMMDNEFIFSNPYKNNNFFASLYEDINNLLFIKNSNVNIVYNSAIVDKYKFNNAIAITADEEVVKVDGVNSLHAKVIIITSKKIYLDRTGYGNEKEIKEISWEEAKGEILKGIDKVINRIDKLIEYYNIFNNVRDISNVIEYLEYVKTKFRNLQDEMSKIDEEFVFSDKTLDTTVETEQQLKIYSEEEAIQSMTDVEKKLYNILKKKYPEIEVIFTDDIEKIIKNPDFSKFKLFYQISKKNREIFKSRIRKFFEKRYGKDTDLYNKYVSKIDDIIDEISNISNEFPEKQRNKVNNIVLQWVLNGENIFENRDRIVQAIKKGLKFNIDFSKHETSASVLDLIAKENKEKIDPDIIPQFTNKKVIGPYTIYDVEDSREGQLAVRKIVDSHFGKEANPWCIIARQTSEQIQQQAEEENIQHELIDELKIKSEKDELAVAWKYWNNYNGQKKIIFKNGKLAYMYAGNKNLELFWDRNDKSHSYIVIEKHYKEITNREPIVTSINNKEIKIGEKVTKIIEKDKVLYRTLNEKILIERQEFYSNDIIETLRKYGNVLNENIIMTNDKVYILSSKNYYIGKTYVPFIELSKSEIDKEIINTFKEAKKVEINKIDDNNFLIKAFVNEHIGYDFSNPYEPETIPIYDEFVLFKYEGKLYNIYNDTEAYSYDDIETYHAYENMVKLINEHEKNNNLHRENEHLPFQDELPFQKENDIIKGAAAIKIKQIFINLLEKTEDTIPHEYAHHFIAWNRDAHIVQEAIKKWSENPEKLEYNENGKLIVNDEFLAAEENLVQAIGEKSVEAIKWWQKFIKWIKEQLQKIAGRYDKLNKEELAEILTYAFLNRISLNELSKVQQEQTVAVEQQQQLNKVEVIDRYSNDIVAKNRDLLFVFGDNVERRGKGGQAIIRDNENIIGIATKKKPTREESSYFTDDEFEQNKKIIDEDINKIKQKFESGNYKAIVFPKNGIGTGLAKLKEKAPKTYEYLVIRLKEEFGFDNETGDIVQQQIASTESEQTVQHPIITEQTQQPITKQTEETEKPDFTSFEEVTLHSGGAIGADTVWSDIAKSYGVKNHNHYYIEGFKTPNGNKPIKLTEQEKQRLDNILTNINEKYLNRQYPPKGEYVTNLLRRNIYQVENSDKILAVSTITNGQVQGGTAWAVYYAISLGKPVYIFDQNINMWYSYNYNTKKFESTITPVLSRNTATIGTRKLNEAGREAIKDVFEKTKRLIQTKETESKYNTDTPILEEEFVIKYDSTSPKLATWKIEDVYKNQLKYDSVTTENGINYLPSFSPKDVNEGDIFEVVIPENEELFLGEYYYIEGGQVKTFRGNYQDFIAQYPEFTEVNRNFIVVDKNGKPIATIKSHLSGHIDYNVTEEKREDYIKNLKKVREKLFDKIKKQGKAYIKITGKGGTYVKVIKNGDITLKEAGPYARPAAIYTNNKGRWLIFRGNKIKIDDNDFLVTDDYEIILQSGVNDNAYLELRLAYYRLNSKGKKIPVFYAYNSRINKINETDTSNIINALRLFVDSFRDSSRTRGVLISLAKKNNAFKGFNRLQVSTFGIGAYLNTIVRQTSFYDLDARSNRRNGIRTVEDVRSIIRQEIEKGQQYKGGMINIKFVTYIDKNGIKQITVLVGIGIKKDEYSSAEIKFFDFNIYGEENNQHDVITEIEQYINQHKDFITVMPQFSSLQTINKTVDIIAERKEENGKTRYYYTFEDKDYHEYLREKYISVVYPLKLMDKNGNITYGLIAAPLIQFDVLDIDNAEVSITNDYVGLDISTEMKVEEEPNITKMSKNVVINDEDQIIAPEDESKEEETVVNDRVTQAKEEARKLGLNQDLGFDIGDMPEPVQVSPEDIERLKSKEGFKKGIPNTVFKQIKNYFVGRTFELIESNKKYTREGAIKIITQEIVDKLNEIYDNLQKYIEKYGDLEEANEYVLKAKYIRDIADNLKNNAKELAEEFYSDVEDMLIEEKEEFRNGDIVDETEIGIDENMEDTNRNVFKSVLEINPKDSLSYNIRRLFTTVVDKNEKGIKRGFGGLHQYIDFDTAYDIVKSILIGERQPEPDIDYMIGELEKHIGDYPWLEDFITKLKNSSSKTQNAFVVNMLNSMHKPLRVLVRRDNDGKTNIYISDESKSNLKDVWKQEYIKGFDSNIINKAGDKKRVNKEVLARIKRKYEAALGGKMMLFKYNSDLGKLLISAYSQANSLEFFIEENTLPKGLVERLKEDKVVTIKLNTNKKYIQYQGYYKLQYVEEENMKTGEKRNRVKVTFSAEKKVDKAGLREVIDEIGLKGLSDKAKGVIIKDITEAKVPFITQWLNYLDEIKGKDMEDIPVPLEYNSKLFDTVANIEYKEQKLSPKLSININGKNLYLAQPTKLISDEVNRIKHDTNKRSILRSISYSKHSFILDLLDSIENMKAIFEYNEIAPEVINRTDVKNNKDKELFKLSKAEIELAKLSLFQYRDSKENVQFEGFNIAISRIALQTISDKERMPILKSYVLDLTEQDMSIEQVGYKNEKFDIKIKTSDKLGKFIYKYIILPEIERIKDKINGIGEHISGFNKGGYFFYNIPELNYFVLKDGKTVLQRLEASEDISYEEIKEVIDSFYSNKISKQVNAYIDSGIYLHITTEKKVDKGKVVKTHIIKPVYTDSRYTGKFTTDNDTDIAILSVADYVINSSIILAETHKIIAGDVAVYFKVNRDIEEAINKKGYAHLTSKQYENIAYSTLDNAVKRYAMLLAPGTGMANYDIIKYVIVEDIKTVSDNYEHLVKLYYNDTSKETKELINKARKGDKVAIGILKDKFPKIKDFLNVTATDSQEYVTVREYLNTLLAHGEIGIEDYNKLMDKYNKQVEWKERHANEPMPTNLMFTKEERELLDKGTFQQLKPVYTKKLDSRGVNNMLYVKIATTPLLPENTFGQIDTLRKLMEKYEKEDNVGVRLTFGSAVKLGSPANKLKLVENGEMKVLTVEDLKNSSVIVPRDGLRIQQETPYKAKKKEENVIRLVTQMWKVLLGDGIADKITFKIGNKEYKGKDLINLYNETFFTLFDTLTQLLLNEIGIVEDKGEFYYDFEVFKEGLIKLLVKEAKKRNYSKRDIESLEAYTSKDKDGKFIVDFIIPLWLHHNSGKFQSLLLSLIKNNIVKPKLPGYGYILSSGAMWKEYDIVQDDSNISSKTNIIFTKYWNGKELTADDKVVQIFIPHRFKNNKGELIDLFEKNPNGKGYKYIYIKNGNYYLKDNAIDDDLLNLVGARIPFSGLISGVTYQVAGFLTENQGDTMIPANSIIVKKGVDFDNDKEWIYMPHHIVTKKNKIAKIKYDDIEELKSRIAKEKEAIIKAYKIKKDIEDRYAVTGSEEDKMLLDRINNNIRKLVKPYNEDLAKLKERIDNIIIDIHLAVFSSDDIEVKKIINQALSLDFEREQANMIEELRRDKQEYKDGFLDSNTYTDRTNRMANGKMAIGAYAQNLTLHAQLTMLEEKPRLVYYTQMPEGEEIEYNFTMTITDNKGIKTVNGLLGNVETIDKDRRISDVFNALENTATDDAKENILGRVNINEETIGVHALLTMLGLDKATITIGEEEKEISIPYFFLSQPMIVDFVEAYINIQSMIKNRKYNLEKEALLEIKDKYGLSINDINNIVNVYKKGNIGDVSINANDLYSNIISPDTKTQIEYIKLFLYLKKVANELRGVNYTINTNNNFKNNLVELRDLINKYYDAFEDAKFIKWGTKLAELKSKNDEEGFKFENYSIKPNNFTTYQVIKAVHTALNIFGQFYLITDPVFNKITDIILGYATGNELDIRKKIEEEYKYFIYSTLPTVEDISKERARLLLDNASVNKLSLGTYIAMLRVRKDKNIIGNDFINKLSISFAEEKGEETAIKFESATGYYDEDHLRTEFVSLMDNLGQLPDFNYEWSEYSDISDKNGVEQLLAYKNKLFTEEDIEDKTLLPEKGFRFRVDGISYKVVKVGEMTYEELSRHRDDIEKFEGKKIVYRTEYFYTPKDLALDLVMYAMITKQTYSYSFARLIPIDILKSLGITDYLRQFDHRKGNNTFIESKVGLNSKEPHLSRFVVQFFQHNPQLAYTVERGKDVDYILVSNAEDLRDKGFGRKIIYSEERDKLYFWSEKKDKFVEVSPVKWRYAVAYDSNSISASDSKSINYVFNVEKKDDEEHIKKSKDKEFRDRFEASNDINDMFAVIENYVENDYDKGLLEIVKRYVDKKLKYFALPKLVFDNNIKMFGSYNVANNTVKINTEFTMSFGIEKTIQTALHELLHFITITEIRQYLKRDSEGKYKINENQPREVQNLLEIYNYVLDIARKDFKEFDTYFTKYRLGEKILDKSEVSSIAYGLSSIEEFITFVLTNNKFKEYLNSKKYEGKTLLQQLLDKIKEFIEWLLRDIKKDSVLEEATKRVISYLEYESEQYKPDLRLGRFNVIINEGVKPSNGAYIFDSNTNSVYTNNSVIEQIANSKVFKGETTYSDGSKTIAGESLRNMEGQTKRYFAKAMLVNSMYYDKDKFPNEALYKSFLAKKSYLDMLLILEDKAQLIRYDYGLITDLGQYEADIRQRFNINDKFDILNTVKEKKENGRTITEPIKIKFDKLGINFIIGNDSIGLQDFADKINGLFDIDININAEPVAISVDSKLEEKSNIILTTDKDLVKNNNKYAYIKNKGYGNVDVYISKNGKLTKVSATYILAKKNIGIKDLDISTIQALLNSMSNEVREHIENNMVLIDKSNIDLNNSQVNKELTVIANSFDISSINITKDNIVSINKIEDGRYRGKYVVLLKDYKIVIFDTIVKKKPVISTTPTAHTVSTIGNIMLTKTQQAAVNFLINSNSKNVVITGKAGTGKTTVLIKTIEKLQKQGYNILVAAPTHAALNVLRKKLSEAGLTIPEMRTTASLLGKQKDVILGEFEEVGKTKIEANVIIIDEASMINEHDFKKINELAQNFGINKVIYSGDIGQLRPVKEEKKSVIFNLPDMFTLTERIRQGEGNPILEYADKFWENNQKDSPDTDPSGEQKTEINDKGGLIFTNNEKQFLEEARKEFINGYRDNNPLKTKIVAYRNATVKRYNKIIHDWIKESLIEKYGKDISKTADGKYIVGTINNKLVGSLITMYDNYSASKITDNVAHQLGYEVFDKADYNKDVSINNSETYMVVDTYEKEIQVSLTDPVKFVYAILKALEENEGYITEAEIVEIKNRIEKINIKVGVIYIEVEGESEEGEIVKHKYPVVYVTDKYKNIVKEKLYEAGQLFRKKIGPSARNYSIYKNIKKGSKSVFDDLYSFADIDYGYAVTSHKSQGATYDSVFVDKNDILSVNPKDTEKKKINRTELKKQLSESVYTGLTRSKYIAVVYDNKHDESYKGESVTSLVDKFKEGQIISNKTNKKEINIWSTEKNGYEKLSNFAIRPFIYEGREYQSVEQAFQLQKYFKYSHTIYNEEIANEMFQTTNGAKLKKLGKQISHFNKSAWDRNSDIIMYELIKASFKQNPDALQLLLSTGNAILTHNNPSGKIDKWTKKFPEILMRVRKELRNEQQSGEAKNNTQQIDRFKIETINMNIYADAKDNYNYSILANITPNKIFVYNKSLSLENLKTKLGIEKNPSLPTLHLLGVLSALTSIKKINNNYTFNIYTNYQGVVKWINGEWKIKEDHIRIIIDAINETLALLRTQGKKINITYRRTDEHNKERNTFEKANQDKLKNMIDKLNSNLPDESLFSMPVSEQELDKIRFNKLVLQYDNAEELDKVLQTQSIDNIIDVDEDMKEELSKLEFMFNNITTEINKYQEIKC